MAAGAALFEQRVSLLEQFHSSRDFRHRIAADMAVYKKKTMRLNEMLEVGLVQDGDMLRYKVTATYAVECLKREKHSKSQ